MDAAKEWEECEPFANDIDYLEQQGICEPESGGTANLANLRVLSRVVQSGMLTPSECRTECSKLAACTAYEVNEDAMCKLWLTD